MHTIVSRLKLEHQYSSLLELLSYFFGLYLFSNIISALTIISAETGNTLSNNDMYDSLLTLFSTGIIVLLFLSYMHITEHRSINTMCFIDPQYILHYIEGIIFGSILFLLPFLPFFSFQIITIEKGNSSPYIILFAIGFIIQSFEEEFLFRGMLFTNIAAITSNEKAAVVSSVCFAGLHLFSEHANIITFISAFLFGMLFCLITINTNSIIMSSGIHFMWNFMQSCILSASSLQLKRIPYIAKLVTPSNVFFGNLICGSGIISIISACLGLTIFFIIFAKQRKVYESHSNDSTGLS